MEKLNKYLKQLNDSIKVKLTIKKIEDYDVRVASISTVVNTLSGETVVNEAITVFYILKTQEPIAAMMFKAENISINNYTKNVDYVKHIENPLIDELKKQLESKLPDIIDGKFILSDKEDEPYFNKTIKDILNGESKASVQEGN